MSESHEETIRILARVERENRINCTGLGEVGCDGRNEWHSWADHRLHVAASQVAALVAAGLLQPPPSTEAVVAVRDERGVR